MNPNLKKISGKLILTKYSKKELFGLDIILLIITHFVVGAFGFLHGSSKMKRDIEKELFKVLDEYKNKK